MRWLNQSDYYDDNIYCHYYQLSKMNYINRDLPAWMNTTFIQEFNR